ncbi:MAG: hypothetical protein ACI9W4_001652 [Rhodothermales bacterium]|jgi:hypothetical protein
MIICTPRTVFSKQFDVNGGPGERGDIEYKIMTEQGTLTWAGVTYEVRKHGPGSGYWSLEDGDEVLADAQKPSPWHRKILVETSTLKLELVPRSVFLRAFDVLESGQMVGSIEPAHALTRRAFLDFGPEVPEHIQLFCFWMVALMWRRARRK